jgi:hypothetical protein
MSDDQPPSGAYPPPPPPPPAPDERPPPAPNQWRRRWPWIVGAVVVLAIIGAAVAATNDDEPTKRTTTDEAAVTTDAPDTTRDTTPPASPEPSAPPTTSSDVAKVGPNEWFTWSDGIEAQVTSLREATVDYASLPGPHVIATITVKNGTAAALDLTMATANLAGGPNGVQEESDGLYGFEGSVPPGGNATADFAWAVPAEHMAQLRLEFAPSFEHDPAFFVGSAA